MTHVEVSTAQTLTGSAVERPRVSVDELPFVADYLNADDRAKIAEILYGAKARHDREDELRGPLLTKLATTAAVGVAVITDKDGQNRMVRNFVKGVYVETLEPEADSERRDEHISRLVDRVTDSLSKALPEDVAETLRTLAKERSELSEQVDDREKFMRETLQGLEMILAMHVGEQSDTKTTLQRFLKQRREMIAAQAAQTREVVQQKPSTGDLNNLVRFGEHSPDTPAKPYKALRKAARKLADGVIHTAHVVGEYLGSDERDPRDQHIRAVESPLAHIR